MPPPPNNRLRASLALSALLHGALLYATVGGDFGGDIGGNNTQPAPALRAARLNAVLSAPGSATDNAAASRNPDENDENVSAVLAAPTHRNLLPAIAANEIVPSGSAGEGLQSAQRVAAVAGITVAPTAQPVAAKAAHPILPVYPEDARSKEIEGQVTVAWLIDETGKVSHTEIIAAQPVGYFEDSVQQALRSTRFIPAQENGIAVKSKMQKVVKYKLEDAAW